MFGRRKKTSFWEFSIKLPINSWETFRSVWDFHLHSSPDSLAFADIPLLFSLPNSCFSNILPSFANAYICFSGEAQRCLQTRAKMFLQQQKALTCNTYISDLCQSPNNASFYACSSLRLTDAFFWIHNPSLCFIPPSLPTHFLSTSLLQFLLF